MEPISEHEHVSEALLKSGRFNPEQKSIVPIQVPSEKRFHGFTYTQISRGIRSCLYRQTYGKKTIAYEVFILIIRKEVTIKGVVYQAHEKWPRDSGFGKTAWTFLTIEDAIAKFNELESCSR